MNMSIVSRETIKRADKKMFHVKQSDAGQEDKP